ncbi:MAG: hypothetical protein CFE37_03695 [Alphaproteobacteria bacterium PA4]|nr:MAG: hypothetical protein CFE37_03695 [Alphaproteobacteria bacterium PA4]
MIDDSNIVLHVRAERFVTVGRPAAYRLASSFLRQHDAYGRHLGLRANKLLVFLVIIVATIQRLVRSGLPPHWLGTAPLDRSAIGFISRRGIARTLDLPPESVRRIVAELDANDWLSMGPRGMIANKPGMMERPETMALLAELAHDVAASAELMIRLGLIEIERAGTGAD